MVFRALTILLALALAPVSAQADDNDTRPHLRPHGDTQQLIVDGAPFLILGGELGNSTASDLDALDATWPTLDTLNLNTLLAPVYWELIEPVEGEFDFALVDGLLEQARAHDMRVVILWFASWKNSMSSDAPAWVKRDGERFPRARGEDGRAQEILSPFSDASLDADRRAFTALMAHLAEVDRQHTVIMVQIENEIGMLPNARDYSAVANTAFAEPVPDPVLAARDRSGETGSWTDVFGASDVTDEMFMAWHFARYVDAIAMAGQAEHDLPMFVNAALNRPGHSPGQYPSAGPLPHLFDIWQAGAPSLNFLAPDIYFPDFTDRISAFRTTDNPLFIPEANRAGRAEAPADALFAFGALDAIGFSPFSIENTPSPETSLLGRTYSRLAVMSALLMEHQGHDTLTGFRPPVSHDGTPDLSDQSVAMGDYTITVRFIDPWTPRDAQTPQTHGGLIIQTGPEEFLVLGHGVTLTFQSNLHPGAIAGIDQIREGQFVDGEFVGARILNGDESHQGRHLRLPPGEIGLQRLRLYSYD
ncbi:DUF5597 domain-containing protein [Maricaulis sp. W15]|uniref:GH35 family beta-galactosidase n=1 Tax=Maricaulis sp. W15 TaxID=1772333 RepID=UPI0009488F76|nr:DUF5597 domain-containing protein [Maricaulis sp. W15]